MDVILDEQRTILLCRKVQIEKESNLYIPSEKKISNIPIMVVKKAPVESSFKQGQLVAVSREGLINKIEINGKKHFLVDYYYVLATVSTDKNDRIIYEEDLIDYNKEIPSATNKTF